MKIGLFSEAFNQFAKTEEKYQKIGSNTGNLLFLTALWNIVDCEIVRPWEREKVASLDAIITTELIWLREGAVPTAHMQALVESTSAPRIIPISVGLQASEYKSDFSLAPEMSNVLEAIQERSIIGVRGEYTAGILQKHGIKNINIIGCPSVYQLPIYHESLEYLQNKSHPTNAVANYRTFCGMMNTKDINMLRYISENCHGFIEQTLDPLDKINIDDVNILKWINNNSHVFFDQEEWLRHVSRYDFCFGLRFHGNVAALLAGVPALFVTIDSRTKEMTDFFRLPNVEFNDFSDRFTLAYYRDKANYSDFSSIFPDRCKNFLEFLKANGLRLRNEYRSKIEGRFTA